MHTDLNNLKNRKQIKVTESQAEQLINQKKKFDKQFEIMQQEFQQSTDQTYFIVSVKFIAEWQEFCQSVDSLRLEPHPMNYDLYQNGDLKKGLVEKGDFELVNETIYQLFMPFTDKTKMNRRQAVTIGHEKRVPIYLTSFKFVYTTLEILKNIDLNRADISTTLILRTVHISESSTLNQLIDAIKTQESLPRSYNCRLWIPQKQLTIEKLFSLIKKQLKPCNLHNYKVEGVGKRLEDLDAKISDLMLDEQTYFILQTTLSGERFIFVKQNQGRCEGCNHFGTLEFPCGCNKVKYCSEKCLEKDKHYHTRVCSYAEEMELNKKVDMTLSPKNRHGLVGLNNLGNTCFMNSCLQCLSHTIPLTRYFLQGYFESEINKVNPIGTKGKLVKNYAKFIKGTWCDQEDTYAPYNVKNAVSDINPMFSGYAQHDSQEFFSFLVDGLHEDLNRIEKKPYVESVEQGNKSEAQLAKQSWVAHLKRNQSIITDLMTGQYRSIVTCPECQHKSTTFDPFITVSLTIPQSIENVTDFFLIHSNMEKKNKRAWFKYTRNDAEEWNRKACQAVGADPARCCLYVVSGKQNIYRVGRDSMAEISHKIESEGKNMFLIEFSEEEISIPKEHSIEFTIRYSKSGYHRSQELFFKIPMIFDKRNLTGLQVYKKLAKFLYSEAYDFSKNRVGGKSFLSWGSKDGAKEYEEYEKQVLKQRPFKALLRVGKKIERSFHRVEVQFKKQIEIEDTTSILELLENQQAKNIDCQLDARFDKSKTDGFTFDKLKDFDTIGKEPKTDKIDGQISLDKCLESFSSPEVLEAGNEWYCPKCKEHKLARKELSIYRAPKVLILHLKRFKQKGTFKKEKNETLVRFPSQLDLKPYVINENPMQAYKQEIQRQVFIPSKAENLPFTLYNTKSKPVYELYAISNHYGGLGGGHYTAFAKNNGEWYEFDDSRVGRTGRKDIVGSSAYLLFYERKQ